MAQATAPPRSIERLLRPTTRALIGLYLGDRDSFGYYSPRIVFEVCRRLQPQSFEFLRKAFYGRLSVDEIDSEGYEALQSGWEAWTHLRELRKVR